MLKLNLSDRLRVLATGIIDVSDGGDRMIYMMTMTSGSTNTITRLHIVYTDSQILYLFTDIVIV